jgi:single-strand DNA-binding protein
MSTIAQAARVHKNEVHLRGILARNPELRKTASGKLVANVTVATTYETRTEFTRCVFWEQHAERLSDAFHNGDFIALHGRLQTRSWDADGTKRYVTEVVVWNFSDGADESKSGVTAARAILAPSQTTPKNAHGVAISPDDIPF